MIPPSITARLLRDAQRTALPSSRKPGVAGSAADQVRAAAFPCVYDCTGAPFGTMPARVVAPSSSSRSSVALMALFTRAPDCRLPARARAPHVWRTAIETSPAPSTTHPPVRGYARSFAPTSRSGLAREQSRSSDRQRRERHGSTRGTNQHPPCSSPPPMTWCPRGSRFPAVSYPALPIETTGPSSSPGGSQIPARCLSWRCPSYSGLRRDHRTAPGPVA